MPAAPPAVPSGAGVPAVTAPTIRPPAPPPPAPPPAKLPDVAPLAIAFPPGSARLPTLGANAIKAFAVKRGPAAIAVTGFGEAGSDDLDAQRDALSLGMARAQAVAAALTGAGVPDQLLRIEAQAIGRGASARLVN